jgi:putative flippase GtrA
VSQSFIKFLIVGSCAFAVEYGSFYGFYTGLNWRLYIANSISFCLGLLTSFILNRIWTFTHSLPYDKKGTHQLSYYVVLAVINFLLTNLIVEVLARLSVNPLIAKPIAMIVTSLWNYTLFKFFIFNHKKPADAA